MKISSLRLVNVRGFDDLTIDFGKGRLHTVLIGKNGTCKTTLLRSLAIGLADSKDAGGLLAEPNGVLVSEGKSTATIEIELRSTKPQQRHIKCKTVIGVDDHQDVLAEKTPQNETPGDLLVCGYGVARQTEGESSVRPYRVIDSVYSLFVYDASLVGIELTLRRLQDYLGTRQFNSTLAGIKKVLGLTTGDKITLPKGGGVVVSGPSIGKSIPIEGWADGYRKTLVWILDLYAWAMRAKKVTKDGGISGVLLVDEIEQHLHPTMQTTLLKRLVALFPDLQLIATTHSPLVALGADPESVVVLKRSGTRVVRDQDMPDFTTYSVEDMLSDPDTFDTPVYRPEVNTMLTRYHALSSKSKNERTSEESLELKTLVEHLSAQQIPAVYESPSIKKLEAILQKHNL